MFDLKIIFHDNILYKNNLKYFYLFDLQTKTIKLTEVSLHTST